MVVAEIKQLFITHSGACLPLSQAEHPVDPGSEAKKPLAHSVHTAAASELKRPAPQLVQFSFPKLAELVPGLQLVQVVEPSKAANFPRLHLIHKEAALPLNEPFGQSPHATAADALLKEPASQGWQLAAPCETDAVE